MSLIIVIAVIGLAILLVRQGLRSDRSIRMMTERGRNMARQSAAYIAISDQIAQGNRRDTAGPDRKHCRRDWRPARERLAAGGEQPDPALCRQL
mgnify:CR=1 FL=1